MAASSHQPTTPSLPVRRDGVSSFGFLLVPGFSLMSYAAATEPLRAANLISGRKLYNWWHVTPEDRPVSASNGMSVLPDYKLAKIPDAQDIIFVCAGGNPATFSHRPTFAWLRQLRRRGVTLGGVSGGPYILARAGLLEGRRCTVHWEHLPSFREAFPELDVTRSLFEIDRDRITCSGGIAALDMMAALIEAQHGHELSAAVSEWFVYTQLREGGRPQRMELRFRHAISDENLLAVLNAMERHIERPLPRTRLAKVAGLSVRQLERLFRQQLGRSLHQHYLSLRLGRARKLLRETSLPVFDVALATGFSSASQFSRAFRRLFAQPPSELRAASF